MVFHPLIKASFYFLDGTEVESAAEHNQLGTMISKTHSNLLEMQRRAGKAEAAMRRLAPLWKASWIGLRRRVRVVAAVVQAIYTYALHLLVLTAAQLRMVDQRQQRWLRRVLRMPLVIDGCPTHISNSRVLTSARQIPLSATLQQTAVRWLGHVFRMSDTSFIKKIHFEGGLPKQWHVLKRPGAPRANWTNTYWSMAGKLAEAENLPIRSLLGNKMLLARVVKRQWFSRLSVESTRA
jgi:hypothetical protein